MSICTPHERSGVATPSTTHHLVRRGDPFAAPEGRNACGLWPTEPNDPECPATQEPEYGDGLLVAITERRTRAQIDDLARALGAAVAAERGAFPSVGRDELRPDSGQKSSQPERVA